MKALGMLGRVCSVFGFFVLAFSVFLRVERMLGPLNSEPITIMLFAQALMVAGIALILTEMSIRKQG